MKALNNKIKTLSLLVLVTLLAACYGGSGDGNGNEVALDGSTVGESDTDSGSLVNADFSIAYVDRSVESAGNPTDGIIFNPGGDLFVKDLSSPNATEKNITGEYTQGEGDVSDPEVSYDAKTLLFSMRGAEDETWNLWEYELETEELTRVIADDLLADEGDDVDAAYLPDGRIVFSSNRQEKSKQMLAAENKETYAYLDEYERERTIALHVVNQGRDQVKQISFNQSHDRNPTVLSSGEIMYSRWDHVGNRNHFPLFFTNPDGTSMFVLYGSFSPGNSFLHPREMPDGKVISSLMPLSGTGEGGALVIIDVDNFSENNEPSPEYTGEDEQGQVSATLNEIPIGEETSEFGRYSTPYPLWDGTNRVLVSWTAAQEPDEDDMMMGEDGPPRYGIHMLNLDDTSLRPIALAAEGRILTDPIAIFPRDLPNVVADKTLDADLIAENAGILNVKSVYDTDFLDIMGDRVLTSSEVIPKADDVADLLTLKQASAASRPARFVRVSRAVPTPPGVMTEDVGNNEMEMQEILGYSTVEPDGSLRIKVPADTPLALAVVDAKGRALQSHTNWLQVRPGETRTCNGCHSPRRGSAINSAPIAGDHSGTNFAGMEALGETMAETRTRLDVDSMALKADIEYEDIWTMAADVPDLAFSITYANLQTPAPANGIINYVDHIQPIWDLHNCGGCHTGANGTLDLNSTTSATGRLASFEQLTLGVPELDEDGLPLTRIEEGEIMVVRAPALVEMGSSDESSRTSHLIEKLYQTELRAEQALTATTVNHSGILNDSELRLVQEWIDIGAQYYNSPYEDDAGNDNFYALNEIRNFPVGLDEDVFESAVQPVLLNRCGGCHSAVGSEGEQNTNFSARKFVLTGSVEGDFNITRSLVNDICNPQNSQLLIMPTIIQQGILVHPAVEGAPVLSSNENDYQTILAWIEDAAALNNCP